MCSNCVGKFEIKDKHAGIIGNQCRNKLNYNKKYERNKLNNNKKYEIKINKNEKLSYLSAEVKENI